MHDLNSMKRYAMEDFDHSHLQQRAKISSVKGLNKHDIALPFSLLPSSSPMSCVPGRVCACIHTH